MSWFICRDYSMYYKRHTINITLKDQLIENLENRGNGFQIDMNNKEVAECYFEPGGYGMYAMNQPRTTFDLDDKKLIIDSAKIPELLSDMRTAKIREFSDGTEYVKFYSRFHCLVLTKMERESMLFQLVGQLSKATKEANAFFERSEEAWQAAKQKYEKEHGENSWPIIRARDLTKKNPN